ncbi:GEVED domain-containing protein [Aureisphaera galaxeae]|uniref:GEVED domain-containing protein n=1 Tax=Aureisphaera galaxeae TaxID=1538023 RepID=UPI002350C11E|nr:GEVED domain-containing protein [Aureisphaera galaxeae]MDC8002643.1 GEVED domain-containing protein [Aureisphaera galaxeae]
MKLYYVVTMLLLLIGIEASAQQAPNVESPATYHSESVSMYHVASLASRVTDLVPADTSPKPIKDKRHFGNKVIIGKDPQRQNDYLASNPHPNTGTVRVSPPSLVFDSYSTGGSPSDPALAVGPNHVFVVFNTGFIIYDKNGNALTAQLDDSNIFTNNDTCCDLTVSYDAAADRWVLSILSATAAGNSFSGIQVAVSDGPDPVTAGWNSYQFNMNTDYQKLSVWSDGYYIAANKGGGEKIHAIERDAMLAGAASAGIQGFDLPGIQTGPGGFFAPQAFNVADDNYPAAGDVPFVFLQDDAFGGISDDHIKLWTVNVDWTTPGNSTVSAATEFPVTPFIGVFDGGGFSNLDQPGGGVAIDAIQQTIMNQAMFRKFGTHNSAVFCHVVDTDGGSGELAGIRWYEFRQNGDGQPWSLYQEGTYTSPNGKHAWMGSLTMDSNGNIAMGYSAMAGPTTPNPTDFRVSSYYTGRFESDPLGTMTVIEENIDMGTANIGGFRYGDYGKIDIDPTNDGTFWYITEYRKSATHGVVGAFTIEPPGPDDIGVIAITEPNDGILTANEDVTIEIRNFGSNDITDPEVQYTIDGGTPVVENYSGTIAAGAIETFTFATQADLSVPGDYTIVAQTNLSGDTNTSNDATTRVVTHGILYCEPTAVQGCNLDGIKKFILNTIDADDGGDGCNTEPASSPAGYADRTHLSTVLSNQAGSNVYTLQAQHNWDAGAGVEALSVWIDFDDNGTFEPTEQLIAGEFFQSADVLEDFTLTIPVGAPIGQHRLRAKSIDTSADGDVNDPCTDFAYGEVQDYTVDIQSVLGVNDLSIEAAELLVVNKGNNQFEISLRTSYDAVGSIGVYNLLGQQLAFNNIEKEGDRYLYDLDMSYASKGVYLIKMGNLGLRTFKAVKIVVQ